MSGMSCKDRRMFSLIEKLEFKKAVHLLSLRQPFTEIQRSPDYMPG